MIRHFAALVPTILVVAGACGTTGGEAPVRGASAAGGGPGTGGSAGSIAGGNGGNSGTGGSGFNLDSGKGGNAGSVQGDACAGFELQPEIITTTREEVVTVTEPVALYLMVDQSGSMIGNLWTTAVSAITSFVNDPNSANLDVAIQFFPPLFTDCNPATYATPAVPLGRLPNHAPAIIAEVNNHQPFGIGTPIEAALAGAVQFCSNFKTLPNRDPADEDCVVVFITDGAPSGCNEDFNVIAQLAANGWQNAQVRTFAIGMDGANFTLLNDIATRGNTDCQPNAPAAACNATSGSAGLSAALAAIRETVTSTVTRTETVTAPLACEWGIPDPPAGEEFDPNQVNVDLLANGQKTRFGKVASQAECTNFSNGWYYDDPANPTRIIACPDTCTAVTGTGVAGVSVALGCATEVAVPK